MEFIIQLAFSVTFIFVIIGILAKGIPNHHSNWNILLDGLNYSTLDFYKRLKAELQSHGIENISFFEVSHREGNITMDRRTYLRVKYNEYYYDCCCAPFGNGTFVSWWLIFKQDNIEVILMKIPYLGNWLARKLYPTTYYKVDTASMFMTYAQMSVLKVIDDITEEKGLRSLAADERKPIMKDVFKR